MSETNLVKFPSGGLPTTPDDLVQGLANVKQEIGAAGGMPLLRLLKTGSFAIGPENLEPEEDSLWAANPYSIHHGFAAWGDGELFEEVMVPFNQAPPPKSELRDYGVAWSKQYSVILQCVNGTDKGMTVLYKGTSIGMQNAMKGLIDAIITQVQADPEHIVPVLDLEVDSYPHKQWGKVFIPILEITEWLTMGGESDGGDDDEVDTTDDEEETPPAAARKRKVKADDEEPVATGRRRRRRA